MRLTAKGFIIKCTTLFFADLQIRSAGFVARLHSPPQQLLHSVLSAPHCQLLPLALQL